MSRSEKLLSFSESVHDRLLRFTQRSKDEALKFSVQPSHHPVFVTLKTCLLPLRCDRSPWQSPIQSPDVGHSRGGLVGQVDQDTVGQAEVQDGAQAADFIREGLGQEALQLTHSLLHHHVDPLGDLVPRNEKL